RYGQFVVPRGQPESEPRARGTRRGHRCAGCASGARAGHPHRPSKRSRAARPRRGGADAAGGSTMSLLVVGSVALDSIETPFGKITDALGGSGTFFSAAASLYCGVQLVGVVGDDFPVEQLSFLEQRGVDLTGLEKRKG